ncbi:MAG TPA: class II glutamine amidotransferase, partial [Pilimelia sp.]|nr:class II glutamine amidotransferase [Pilimelia sp.]
PSLYPSIAGSADSEVMFYLALTFGLQEDPPAAVQRMVGFVEALARRHGVAEPLQMTVASTDGDRLWAFRYSSEGKSRSLHYSTAVTTLRAMYPENENLRRISDETRIVVSEPLGELVGAWQPVPESSYGIIQKGADELRPFRPTAM